VARWATETRQPVDEYFFVVDAWDRRSASRVIAGARYIVSIGGVPVDRRHK
jgi:hypothetical protein